MIFKPKAVVLTKFGPDATESAQQIRDRKELERRSGRGLFWWGIGEKGTAESICHLIEQYRAHQILFTPIRDQKPIKSQGGVKEVFVWNQFRAVPGGGELIARLPENVLITSSIEGIGKKIRKRYFALVCPTLP